MSGTSRFLTALRRVIRPKQPAEDAPRGGRRGLRAEFPGRSGEDATVQLDPALVRHVRLVYEPATDGDPDPGEVVWTWVPYEERDGRGKDRPVAVVATDGKGDFLAVELTSKPHDGDGDFLPLGAGAWDASGRPSWARLDRLFRVRTGGMRREAAALGPEHFAMLSAALRARYDWD
ncbi:type II toxin-antitoxin system PemK/MazF family toxin [Agromyces sp. MMS24-K17]|uniref:type II toxin-antitoxin system PemK/MazF family toxin n=1 Tax=Agromyces sp. MMS24-K17 TaxID=3372850 RepID=UPI003754FC68